MKQDFTEANRKRGLYLRFAPDNSVVYVPKGWVDDNSTCEDFDDGDGMCVYGYGRGVSPEFSTEYEEVNLYWYPIKDLQGYDELTEDEAKKLYPSLFTYLDKIDKELAL